MSENPVILDSKTSTVYKAVLDMLLNENLAPGAKLNQNELAKYLGVSRTPLVKALHVLEAQGLVDSAPNRGFTVHRFSVKELLALWEIRGALEIIAIREIAGKISADLLDTLESLFAPFSLSDDEIDHERYADANRRFHSMILNLCQNDLLLKINDHFQILSRSFVAGLLRPPSETLLEHRSIIEALREGSSERAADLLMDHIEKTKRLMEDTMNRLKNMGIDIELITIDRLKIDGRKSINDEKS